MIGSRGPAPHPVRHVAWAAGFLALALPAVTHGEVGNPGACVTTVTRGVELTSSDAARVIRVDHGLAQGFIAPDTLVSSVTIWVPAIANGTSLQLLILRAGDDGRPSPDDVVADGGTIDQGDDDDLQSARYTFTFDPPAVLPAAGRYALVVAAEHGQAIPLLVDDRDEYGDGELWELNRRDSDGRYSSVSARMRLLDLSFRIGFCDGGTTTTGRTWGEVKTMYR